MEHNYIYYVEIVRWNGIFYDQQTLLTTYLDFFWCCCYPWVILTGIYLLAPKDVEDVFVEVKFRNRKMKKTESCIG